MSWVASCQSRWTQLPTQLPKDCLEHLALRQGRLLDYRPDPCSLALASLSGVPNFGIYKKYIWNLSMFFSWGVGGGLGFFLGDLLMQPWG